MRIRELADATGTTTRVLRFYEKAGLLPEPHRTPAGYRDYTAESLLRLDFVRRGKAAGLTLGEIRQVLETRDAGEAPCRHVVALLDQKVAQLDARIAELRALRDGVVALRQRSRELDEQDCSAEQVCRYV